MKKWLHKIEILVDKLIPPLLVILLLIIVGEIWFHEFMIKNHTYVQIIDWTIVFVFVLDLIFKYIRIRNIPKFLRASWLDILAVFPFFLVFRLFEGLVGLFGIGETVTQTQRIVHLGVESEKEVVSVIREGEIAAKEAARSEKMARFLRPLSRGFRFFKAGDKEVREETKEEFKEVERGVVKEGKVAVKTIKKEGEDVVEEIEKVPRIVKASLFYEKPKIMHHSHEKLNKVGNKRRRR